MTIRTAHTYALLEVSKGAYWEIHKRLQEADYQHAFGDEGEIDMHGIALTESKQDLPELFQAIMKEIRESSDGHSVELSVETTNQICDLLSVSDILQARPGDIFVLRLNRGVSQAAIRGMADTIKSTLPKGVKAIILEYGMDFGTLPPIDMLLYCPKCQSQHVDAPFGAWDNPPHRSHLCHSCGHIWRPSDHCTNGVAVIATKGEKDLSPIPFIARIR